MKMITEVHGSRKLKESQNERDGRCGENDRRAEELRENSGQAKIWDYRMEETRLRFIHLDNGRTRVKLLSKFDNGSGSDWAVITVGAADTKSVVLEVIKDEKVVGLRLLHLSNVADTHTFFRGYQFVTEFEVSCPVPISFIFRHLPMLHHLRSLRLKKQTFSKMIGRREPGRNFLLLCPLVETFRVSYDVEVYSKLPALARDLLESRISTALQFGIIAFPGLQKISIKVPKKVERELDWFVQSYPRAPPGEKVTTVDGSVIYSNLEGADYSDAENHGDHCEYNVQTTEEQCREQFDQDYDDDAKKLPSIRFQTEDEDEPGARSDAEVPHSSSALRGILKFFRTKRSQDGENLTGELLKPRITRARSCPARKDPK